MTNNLEWSPDIICHNIRGLNLKGSKVSQQTRNKIEPIKNILKANNCDIIVLQETHTSPTLNINRIQNLFGKSFKLILHSATQHISDGILVYCAKNIKIIKHGILTPGRVSYIQMKNDEFSNTNNVFLYNIYNFTTPTGKQIETINSVSDHINGLVRESVDRIIFCGDMNVDLSRPSRPNGAEDSLRRLLEVHHLTDVGQALNNLENTWRGDGRRASSTSRLDAIYASGSGWWNKFRFKLFSNCNSDHLIILLSKNNDNYSSVPPPPRWQNSILFNRDFKSENEVEIKKFLIESNISYSNASSQMQSELINRKLSFFDLPCQYVHLPHKSASLLQPIINITKTNHDRFLKNRQSCNGVMEKRYQKAFNKLCVKSCANPTNTDICEQIDILKKARKQEIATALLKSKKFHANMNALNNGKPTSYAFRPFKQRESNKITQLIDNGKTFTENSQILEIMDSFQRSKTSASATFSDNNNDDCNVPLLNEELAEPISDLDPVLNTNEEFHNPGHRVNSALDELDIDFDDIFQTFPELSGPVTFSSMEVKKVIKSLKNVSSPGPSGEPKQLYLYLFNLLPKIVTETLNNIKDFPDISATQFSWIKERRIIFIPKKGRIRTDPSSYRPISLFEVLYKIISKLLARKLNPFLDKIVSQGQFGFVPGRHMSVASHTVIAAIAELQKRNHPSFALFLDIQCAFDTADQSALNFLMQKIFPNSNMAEIIAGLTDGGFARVSVNGTLGPLYQILTGTGQGDPLSSGRYLILHHLFLQAIFSVLQKPEHSHMLIDITPGDTSTNKFSPLAFADDSTLFIKLDTEDDSRLLINIFGILALATGLKIHPNKSKILALGIQDDSNTRFAELLGSVVQQVEHLGVIIAPRPLVGRDATYTLLQAKIAEKLKTLSGIPNTDLFHKKLLIQTLVSSCALHIFRVYPPTDTFLQWAWKSFRTALWSYTKFGGNHKRYKIAENRLEAPVHSGGLGFASPTLSANNSYVGAIFAIFLHAFKQPQSDLNHLFRISELFRTQIQLLGSKSLDEIPFRSLLSKLIPGSVNRIDALQQTLIKMEMDPNHFFRGSVHSNGLLPMFRIPLMHFDPGGPLEWNRSVLTLLNIPNKKLATPVSLHPEVRLRLLEHGDASLLTMIQSLVDNVARRCPVMLPFRNMNAAAASFSSVHLNYGRGIIQQAAKKYKRVEFDNCLPPAYETRIRDGVDCPRDKTKFSASYLFIEKAPIPSSLKSFQLELLNRTLCSPAKMVNMKIWIEANQDICPFCHVLANTSHVVTYCVIPTMFFLIFKLFRPFCRPLSKFQLEPTSFEFSFPMGTVPRQIEVELQHIFISIKRLSLLSHLEPRFSQWNRTVLYAKILTTAKSVFDVRRFSHQPCKISESLIQYMIDSADHIIHAM